jgi:hypothetical protein
MSILFLTEQLNNMENPKRENRQRVANVVLKDQKLCKDLLSITFDIDHKVSITAAWILEWICSQKHINWISPNLDEFSTKISTLKFDSSIRFCATICELLAIDYCSKNKNEIRERLTNTYIDRIIETGFDWLITPQKIAIRVYTMTTLYLFGLERDWVHLELKHLIITTIIHESKG